MGNLNSINCYGYDFGDYMNQGLSMQWHLTVNCDQKCKHCYMYHEDNLILQKKNQLSTGQAYQLIDEFYHLAKKLGTIGRIFLTGGDPILSNNFWDVLNYVKRYGEELKIETIMGNSYHIDDTVAKQLKDYGIKHYQISLDGLEETHDNIRKRGSFRDSLRALKILHEAGIKTDVMTTVQQENCSEILELYKFVKQADYIDNFAFDRMIPIGNGKVKYGNSGIVDKNAYQDLLCQIYEYEVLSSDRKKLAYKDKLWKLFLYENGLADPIEADNVGEVCMAGGSSFCVLADGEVYACRRLNIVAGKFPEQSLEKIYFQAPLFRMLRAQNKTRENACSECVLVNCCGGCPAAKYALTGSIYGADPSCWSVKVN